MKSTLLASSLALAGICAVPAIAADAEVSIDFKSAYVATGATCLDGWVAMPNLWVGGIKAGETSKDGLFTIEAIRCIGACALAPAMSINGKVYPKVTPDQVGKIIEEYRKLGAEA